MIYFFEPIKKNKIKIINIMLKHNIYYFNFILFYGIGDSGYDSNKIRNKLEELNLGRLITKQNIRNTKNKNKLNKLKLSNKEKKYLIKRYAIKKDKK